MKPAFLKIDLSEIFEVLIFCHKSLLVGFPSSSPSS